jgi:hypothetical protein
MMLRLTTFGLLAIAGLSWGCAGGDSFVKAPDATLGRVVIYRNGVAYFERFAKVTDGELKLAVPADKVDDFLKSLTVVDAKSGQPAPVSYPTSGTAADSEGLVRMAIQVPKNGPHELKLSYVTEAPSWKPSYRITLNKDGKLDLQAWAIVDNTSGEDWRDVMLGVGSSSALSFRFDLRSVRLVERETLQTDLPFAMAPPSGGASFGDGTRVTNVLGEISEVTLAQLESQNREADEEAGGFKGSGRVARREDKKAKPADPGSKSAGLGQGVRKPAQEPIAANDPVTSLARQIVSGKQKVVIEGFAGKDDSDKNTASLDRANKLREQLIRNGVPPEQVVAVGNGEQRGRGAGVRIVQPPPPPTTPAPIGGAATTEATEAQLNPIDTSHFESKVPMTVARGTSAMVSIYNGNTDGEVVYLYDAETPRGNASFPFRSVRIKNPTESALEAGPFTVFGEGRFIGEGLSEAIPPNSTAFVPFALDRQIIVERKDEGRDEIAKIISVQRGVFSTEVQEIKKMTFTLTNRLPKKATVYVRHTVPKGFKLTKAPQRREKFGASDLFLVDVEPGAKTEITIEEATPVLKTTDIRSNAGMEMVRVFLSSAAIDAGLKEKVAELVKTQTEIANLEQKINTAREQMGEYRTRMDELHNQIFTLKAVRTAGPLMRNLETKLQEMSDRVSKATIDVVGLEEQVMVNRIKFQDKVAELTLEKKEASVAAKP